MVMTHNTAIAGMADPVLRALTGTSASAAVQHVLINRGFGDPDSTLTPHGSTPRTAASLKDVGLTDVIKAAIEYVLHGG